MTLPYMFNDATNSYISICTMLHLFDDLSNSYNSISINYISADNLCKLCDTVLCLINFKQVDVSRIV